MKLKSGSASILILIPIFTSAAIENQKTKRPRFLRSRDVSSSKFKSETSSQSNILIEGIQHNSNFKKYLHTQKITSSKTIKAFDLEYSLHDLSPSNVYSTTAAHMFNNQIVDLPNPTIFEKKLDEEHIIASYNGQNEIKSIIIHDKVRRRTAELVSIDDNQLVTVSNTDYSTNSFSQHLKIIFHTALGFLDHAEEIDKNLNEKKNLKCTELKAIDLAVVYDSSYCNKLNGKENAEAEIASIVSMVSNKFEQDGLCLKVEISYLEGYCDVTLDPYSNMMKDGVDSIDLLRDFRSFWIDNRKDVNRSVAHLFTATGMAKDVLGRGYTGTICSKDSAYAVEEVSWSSELAMKAAVVTHELGHNLGANHVEIDSTTRLGCSSSNDFLMQPEITEGVSGFNEETIEQMREVVDSRSCFRTVEE